MRTDHLLIIRFSALGDVAMTVPVIYSLANQYPQLRIGILSRPYAHAFFDDLAPNVTFMAADLNKEYQHLSGINKLYRRLMAKQFTAIADFHDIIRTKYLRSAFLLDGIKVAHINKHRSEKRKLTSTKHKELFPIQSSFQNYTDVLKELGYPVELNFKSIFPPEGGDINLLEGSIESKEDKIWIGIAPFAAHKSKVYPLNLMEQIIVSIQNNYPNSQIFLFGGKEDELNQLNQWSEKYNNCINASALLKNLRKELILMSHLNVMITMDSANMHLASLVNIPAISIWGGTHPYAGFKGWNQTDENIVQTDLPCRPCSIYGKKPCMRNDYACLNNIRPEQIIQKLANILKSNYNNTSINSLKSKIMKKYVCDMCGYIYDPELGDPDGNIAPGTAFEDIPDDWVCPLCGVSKDDFSLVEE